MKKAIIIIVLSLVAWQCIEYTGEAIQGTRDSVSAYHNNLNSDLV